MRYSQILLLLLLLTIFVACDVVEPPYKTVPTITNKDTIRRVGIIEFTGINCSNCPDGHEVLHTLEENYGDLVIPLSFHPRFLNVIAGYDFDLSTQTGHDFLVDYQLAGLPMGIVNSYERDSLSYPGEWEDEVVNILLDTSSLPLCLIEISNSYNSMDSTVTSNINVDFLSGTSAELYIAVYIAEDSITGPQNDHTVIVDEYLHRHTVRGSLNSTYGEMLTTETISPGIKVNKSYMYKLSEDFETEQCYIVVFIYDNATKEILQAEEHHIID